MSDVLYGVYGASGFGLEVMDWFKRQLRDSKDDADVVFVDDGVESAEICNTPVWRYSQFKASSHSCKKVALAISSGVTREKLDKILQADGIPQIAVRGQHTFVRGAQIDEGSFLSAFVDVTANVRIGRCFHANTYSYIGHDCVIGDYVTFAPRVSCNGNVHIADHAYIGTAAVLRQGKPGEPLRIGRGAVVGMGAVVTKDVPDGTTVVGNPARPLGKK